MRPGRDASALVTTGLKVFLTRSQSDRNGIVEACRFSRPRQKEKFLVLLKRTVRLACYTTRTNALINDGICSALAGSVPAGIVRLSRNCPACV